MKLRILFLKKRYIYFTLLGIALLILIIILFTCTHSTSTLSIAENNISKKTDLTGDGKDDILSIKTNKDKYSIQVNANGEVFSLTPDKSFNTLGSYSTYWPIRTTILDITRDKIPEVILQDSNNNLSLQHIFMWTGSDFKDIFCSTNNVIGFIDSQNNKTPKMASGTMEQDKVNLSYYYFSSNKLQSFSYNDKPNFMGKNTVQAFITYIQSLPNGEANKPKDIFINGISGKDASVIGKLAGDNNTYTFQDCMFKDTQWDKSGNPTEIKWTISFKAVSTIKSSDIKNYTMDVFLKPDESCSGDDGCYKIFKINLQ